MKNRGKIIVFILAFLVLTTYTYAVAATPPPLPPAAQEALNNGILAAKLPDYLLAIRYFEEARKIAPQAPVIYLNMGLAESRIPGRELRAIAWFGAYLAAYPGAPNAAAVKEQIAVLKVRNQSNVSRLIKSVNDAASRISGWEKDGNLTSVAGLWAKTGDITAAFKTADLIQNDIYKDSAKKRIAEAQAEDGDIAGAQKTADSIQRPDYKGSARRIIAVAQAWSGDIVGAQKTVDLIDSSSRYSDSWDDSTNKIMAQRTIAMAQVRYGDIAGAQRTTDLISDIGGKRIALWEIAVAKFNAGDIDGTKKTLTSAAIDGADLLRDTMATKAYLMVKIAELQARVGDLAGAEKTRNLISSEYVKRQAQQAIANAKATAVATNAPNSTRQATTDAKPVVLPVITASNWIKRLDDTSKYNRCPLNAEPFLDMAGYLKSLPPSDSPQKNFETLHEAAKKIVDAQNVIHQMLKQGAGK